MKVRITPEQVGEITRLGLLLTIARGRACAVLYNPAPESNGETVEDAEACLAKATTDFQGYLTTLLQGDPE